jgi:hypothetical protein
MVGDRCTAKSRIGLCRLRVKTRKSSERAYAFRCAPDNGHASLALPLSNLLPETIHAQVRRSFSPPTPGERRHRCLACRRVAVRWRVVAIVCTLQRRRRSNASGKGPAFCYPRLCTRRLAPGRWPTRAETSGAPPLLCKAGFALEKMVYPPVIGIFSFSLGRPEQIASFYGRSMQRPCRK